MASISPIIISGSWLIGYALDLHTISSNFIGYNEVGRPQFDNQRSELGQLIYDVKYSGKLDAAADIIDTAYDFIIKNYLDPPTLSFNVVVPVPPSSYRTHQPVLMIAEGIAKKLEVPFNCCISCNSASQVKNIQDQEERDKELENKYAINTDDLKGLSVLLIDDLYRSGSTLNVIANLAFQSGKAVRVDVLTITKTRSNR